LTGARREREKRASPRRLRARWGVFSNRGECVVVFEDSQRDEAEEAARRLTTSTKSSHFVGRVKEEMPEAP
jgi:hypothetical protein